MFQGPPGTLPSIQKVMFHVKHTPIEKLPATGGRTLQEPKSIGIDELKRERLDQPGHSRESLAGEANLEFPTVPMPAYAEGYRRVTRQAGVKNQFFAVVGYRITKMPGTKRAPHAEQVDALEQAGLATPIVASNEIDSFARLEINIPQVA
ncbi:hypothetical protein GCM10017767_17740 [Halomonas urumqiensis]|nr:hypothetical protein GCM10017767_17740 [Halomonas urumqiensis]